MADLSITPQLTIPAALLRWTAARASGPGGQHVNRTASKVDLRFDLEASEQLSPEVKERLRRLAGVRLDAAGCVVVTAQANREQGRNLELAREKLAALIRQALVRPTPRRATRPSRGQKRRRLEDKRRRAQVKADRRRPGDG